MRPYRLSFLRTRVCREGGGDMTMGGETPGRIVLRVEVETKEGQLKQGTAGQFTVMCDEGPHLGGKGTAPPPLHYFLLATGF